nr:MAG TPA: hypothetical protein [Crassvirales sp.]
MLYMFIWRDCGVFGIEPVTVKCCPIQTHLMLRCDIVLKL